MMVVVEARRPRCCYCKQIGHIAKVCPQKAADTTQQPKKAEDNTTNAIPEAEKTNSDNEWTQVTRRRKRGMTLQKLWWNPTRRRLRKLAPTSSKNKDPPLSSPVTQKTPSAGIPSTVTQTSLVRESRRRVDGLHRFQTARPARRWLHRGQCWSPVSRWEACGVSRDPSCG